MRRHLNLLFFSLVHLLTRSINRLPILFGNDDDCNIFFVQISPQQLLVRHLAAPLADVNVPKHTGQDDSDGAEENRNVNTQSW